MVLNQVNWGWFSSLIRIHIHKCTRYIHIPTGYILVHCSVCHGLVTTMHHSYESWDASQGKKAKQWLWIQDGGWTDESTHTRWWSVWKVSCITLQITWCAEFEFLQEQLANTHKAGKILTQTVYQYFIATIRFCDHSTGPTVVSREHLAHPSSQFAGLSGVCDLV